MIEKLTFKIKKNLKKNDDRDLPLPLWGQLKIIIAMLILNLVFNFTICTDMMMKKQIQSDINDEPLISKIMYLAIMIKIVMKDFVDRKTGISWWWVNIEAKEEEEKE